MAQTELRDTLPLYVAEGDRGVEQHGPAQECGHRPALRSPGVALLAASEQPTMSLISLGSSTDFKQRVLHSLGRLLI